MSTAKKIAVIGVPGGWSSERLADAVAEQTGYRRLVDLADVVLDLDAGRAYEAGENLCELDAVVIKKAGPYYSPNLLDRMEILRYLAARGVRVFSDPTSIMRVLDRLSCTVALRLGGAPMPATVVTERVDRALDFLRLRGSAVLKPLFSTKARGMVVVQADDPEARAKIQGFSQANPVMYLQAMVEHPGHDLAVAFLGGKPLATYARVGAKDSWNTTTRSGGACMPYDPPREVLEVADKAQALFGLDFTCVDVVETPDGPQVFEVSAFGGFKGLLQAHDIDAAALYARYVLDQL